MPWEHAREVHVSSRAALDRALRSADRIVVEGDATLADYARRLANQGQPHGAPVAAGAARLRPLAETERAAHVTSRSRPPRLWPWVAGALGLTLAAGAALLLEHFAAPGAAAHAMPAALPAATDLTILAWPAVAVTLLLALYLLARQTVAADRDGRIAWRVSEKTGGPVVITKVRAGAA